MKFTQVILMLAVALACVGLAAAVFGRKSKKAEQKTEFKVEIANPCVEEETDEACDRCCVKLGDLQTGLGSVKSGVMLEELVNEYGHFEKYRACFCAPFQAYGTRVATWVSED